MGDDDLKAALPDPPPPSPRRREAAIAEAMARFDGRDEAYQPAARRPAQPRAPRGRFGWPQVGAFAAAALVAAISVPIWQATQRPHPAVDMAQVAPAAKVGSPRAAEEVAATLTAAPISQLSPALSKSADVAALQEQAPPVLLDMPEGAHPPAALAPAPAPPVEHRAVAVGRSAAASGTAAQGVISGVPVEVPAARAARADSYARASAAPPAGAANGREEAEAGADIVVTSARVAARARPLSNDWSACTVNDSDQDWAKCPNLANKAPRDVRDQAAKHLADGLEKAWQGNLAGATAEFDSAIRIAPRLSVAYLNRGLLRDRQGDRAGAVADLDQAVRYAPWSAAAYYNRSALFRKYGNAKRAEADDRRARKLDDGRP